VNAPWLAHEPVPLRTAPNTPGATSFRGVLGIVALIVWNCGLAPWRGAVRAEDGLPCPLVQLGVPIFSRPTGRPDLRVADDVLAKAPREVQERLAKARQAVSEGRLREAVAGIQAVLDGDDGFLPTEGNAPGGSPRTVRHEAARLFAAMPAEARQSYEVQFGAQARAALTEAAAHGDRQAVAGVAGRWCFTRAGREATLLLARDALDRGSPREALFRLSRLDELPDAAPDEPERCLLAAIAWHLLGDQRRARLAIDSLARHTEGMRVRLGPREFSARNTAEILAWIGEQFPAEPRSRPAAAHQWPLFRGNAARNAQAAAGGVAGPQRWRVQSVEDPGDLRLLQSIQQQAWSEGTARLPVVHPIVLDGIVVTRTPWRVLALDAATGRQRWEHRAQTAAPRLGNTPDRAGPFGAAELLERVAEDAGYGQLAGDGRRVFVVEPIEGPSRTKPAAPASPLAAFVDPSELPNRLVALELGDGRTAWTAGGEQGGAEPKLAGAFFLGAPLPEAGRLYALVERRGVIWLAALDAATGRLVWWIPIAHPRDGALQDPVRRLSGASPSLADGVIVCPTSAGVVVGVDASTRSILWGYAYRRTDPLAPPPKPAGPGDSPPSESLWTDSAATIAEGRVLVTPFDSDQLHCLDLFSGRPLWATGAGSMLYVACVHKGNVILVGSREVVAWRLENGRPAWPARATPLPEKTVPAGRGLWCGDRYDLPIAGGRILRIDLATGRIAATVPCPAELGNLTVADRCLISQTAEATTAFDRSARPGTD
jgi:outer membrane protein assembly factor BamB